MNPLEELSTAGQSFWLDYLSRDLIGSGELKKLVKNDGLRGITSNPTIFEKAISGGHIYDAEIKKGALKGKTIPEIYEDIAVKDIQLAADHLLPVFKSTRGQDGFVSLEVSPYLAYDTDGTVAEAKKLFKKVNRPNLMVKIPGTGPGLEAIEECIALGININVTLLFSVDNYREAADSYMRGLERRVKKGQSIKSLSSVASFFVSRLDVAIDKLLEDRVSSRELNQERGESLLHKAAIANSKMAFLQFREMLESKRWQSLAKKGAQPQRVLWASTGTKDKRLSDVVYVEELVGPHTVNTMPPQTAQAFRDHGKIAPTLSAGVDSAKQLLKELHQEGISLERITHDLQKNGVKLFTQSFNELLLGLAAKKEILVGDLTKRASFSLASYQKGVDETLRRATKEKWMERLWKKDTTLWKRDDAHKKIIENSLGWLDVIPKTRQGLPILRHITADVKAAKFTNVLLLGMGGSSLAPEVLRLTFGKKVGGLEFDILDSTEPASVQEKLLKSKPAKTLYIVASKSGTTVEPNAFLATFFNAVRKVKGARAGENFIAITDPGTMMERLAKEKSFRHVVINPPDIGGRFSALSFFGMLPAMLMGIDVEKILSRAEEMAGACSPLLEPSKNLGAQLGSTLGDLALKGKDKVTFILSPQLASFSTWLEQLIAESTGKEGKGILPVESEPLLPSFNYALDRVFVHVRLAKDKAVASEKILKNLEKEGHPVIRLVWNDLADIGGAFFLWEIATAVAGIVMGINAFDQPNVQEAKDLTKEAIDAFKSTGNLHDETPLLEESGIAVTLANSFLAPTSLTDLVQGLVKSSAPGTYLAILAYLTRNKQNEEILGKIREELLKKTHMATTLGFGPRFLHSTGQLHKGGANNGIFIQITAVDSKDTPIPGEPFGFHVLKEAQARGDFAALKNKDRRIIKFYLKNPTQGLKKLLEIVQSV